MLQYISTWAVIVSMGVCFFAHADINTENMWGRDDNDWDNRIRVGRDGGQVNRVGAATVEGTLYYAFRNSDNRVRVAPSLSMKTGIWPNVAEDACVYTEMGDTNWVVDLIPREGLVWLVQHDKESVLITALRRPALRDQLVKVRELTIQRPEGHPNATISGVAAIAGSEGIYIHTFWDANGQCYLSHHIVAGETVTPLAAASGLFPSAPRVRHPALIDGVATQRLINVGTPDLSLGRLHVIAYAGWDNQVRLVTFDPTTYKCDVLATGSVVQDPDWTILSLVDGVLEGDPCPDYAVTLLEARRADHGKPVVRALSWPVNKGQVAFNPPEQVFLRFDGKNHERECSMHWGIDKTDMRSTGKVEPALLDDPGEAFFTSSMQQQFRIVLFTRQGEVPGPFTVIKKTHFHSVTIFGNRFETLPIADTSHPSHQRGIHLCDTSTDWDLVSAWTLVGVVHGVPPYPLDRGGGFPTVTFNFSKSYSKEDSVTAVSEDSMSYTFGLNFGGGDEYGARKIGIFSLENSYSYGVKSEAGNSTSTTNTITVNMKHTFEPRDIARSFLRQHPGEGSLDPSTIGYLIYSCPVLATKSYSVRRWDKGDFADPGEFVTYLTAVDSRRLRFFPYQLEHPERGPFYPSQDPEETRAGVALTEGIAPVPRTSDIEAWKKDQSHLAEGKRTLFPSGNMEITASTAGSSEFELSFLKEDSTGKMDVQSKSHSGSSHLKVGIKAIFNVDIEGAWGHTETVTKTSRTTTAFGSAISGTFPKLPSDQPIKNLTIRPILMFPNEAFPNANEKVPWVPNSVAGSAPFLLTWKVEGVLQRRPNRQK